MKISELAATKWSGRDVKIATAVALAESRGKMDATNTNSDGSTDDGPWQVNSVHGYDRDRLRSDPGYTVNAAYEVYEKQGWRAWTVYKTGAYLAFMGQDADLDADDKSILEKIVGMSPVGIIGGRAVDVVTDPVQAAAGGINVIGDVIGALTEPSTWLRIGKGYLGSMLIVAGVGGLVFVVASRVTSSPVVKTAVGAATTAIPGGGAVKGAAAATKSAIK